MAKDVEMNPNLLERDGQECNTEDERRHTESSGRGLSPEVVPDAKKGFVV